MTSCSGQLKLPNGDGMLSVLREVCHLRQTAIIEREDHGRMNYDVQELPNGAQSGFICYIDLTLHFVSSYERHFAVVSFMSTIVVAPLRYFCGTDPCLPFRASTNQLLGSNMISILPQQSIENTGVHPGYRVPKSRFHSLHIVHRDYL